LRSARRLSDGCLLLLLLGLGLLQGNAAAQTQRQRAEALLRTGNRLHDQGDFQGALDSYRAAQKLFPSYKIDFNIGLTLEAMGQPERGLPYFESFIRRADATVDAAKIEVARLRVAALRRKVSSIRVSCSVAGATVLLDGKKVGQVPLETELYLPPGRYRLAVSMAGYQGFEQTLHLEPGDHPTVTVRLAARQRPRPQAVPLPAPALAGPRRVWTWVTGGAALASLAVALGFGISARADYNNYLSTPDPDVYDRKRSSVRWKALAANICFGVAGAAGAAAVTLFFMEPRLRAEKPSRTRGARLQPLLGSTVGVRGEF
jgi:tetratricopeptide (TPR) repeat protein